MWAPKPAFDCRLPTVWASSLTFQPAPARYGPAANHRTSRFPRELRPDFGMDPAPADLPRGSILGDFLIQFAMMSAEVGSLVWVSAATSAALSVLTGPERASECDDAYPRRWPFQRMHTENASHACNGIHITAHSEKRRAIRGICVCHSVSQARKRRDRFGPRAM